MNGNLGRDKVWNQQIWDDIDHAVRDEMGRIRVAQKVFPSALLPDGEQVPADKLGSGTLNIEEGNTKPLVEIWAEFTLSQSQVDSEERLHTARTLARMAATRLAVAEDMLLFQGKTRAENLLKKKGIALTNAGIQERNATHLGEGFLGEAADPGAKKLKTEIDAAAKLKLDYQAGADVKRKVREFVNKTREDKELKDFKKELDVLIKDFPDGDQVEKLKEAVVGLTKLVADKSKFRALKERLENIEEKVPYHVAAKDLKDQLLLKGLADTTKFKDVRTEIYNLTHRMPDYVAGQELKSDLEDLARMVSHEIEVRCWKKGAKGRQLDPTELIRGILNGIAQLTSNAQSGPYALFVPPDVFAESSVPLLSNSVAPADRITPLVTGGYHGTGCLSDKQGLLVSLGGEPSTIYMGDDATTAFTQVEANGIYRFRVFERIQFVAREPRAFVLLEFTEG
jgi:uncharacterized linocin/CFP29 family protein